MINTKSKARNDQIMVIRTIKVNVGRMLGRVTCQKRRNRVAPSTRAAS